MQKEPLLLLWPYLTRPVYRILSKEAVKGLPKFPGSGNRPHTLRVSSKIWKERVEPEILLWPFLESTMGHSLHLPKPKRGWRCDLPLPEPRSPCLGNEQVGAGQWF